MKYNMQRVLEKAKLGVVILLIIIVVPGSKAQNTKPTMDQILGQVNTITTSVPFLLIAPDARAGAMGDAGVASIPDATSSHWNPAKYAFIEEDRGVSISYSPWLQALVDDISLMYVSGYTKLGDQQAIAVSLLYFTLGEIMFTDAQGNDLFPVEPKEFAIDVAYARKLADNFSGAIALRYINSNLTEGRLDETHAGQSIATDVSMYYQKNIRLQSGIKGIFGFGLNISNIGAKISYTGTTERDFIPTNLRIGPSLTLDLDKYNRISFMVDFNKLLIPTSPIYDQDTLGMPIIIDGKPVILKGKDPDVSVVSGIFQSFSDAPGGFKEELREVMYSIGVEYWYDKQFAIRGGYFHEHPTKGNRKFFTLGAGLKYNIFGLDFSYLIPVEQRNPLENTLRFTLRFDFMALAGSANDRD